MVAVMVQQFREMQLRLADMIEQYETAEFRALDSGIAKVFEAIYRHEPRDPQEAHTMAQLFLELIENNDHGNSTHLIERIRAIIGTCTDRYMPAMEIVHGAGI